MDYKIDALNYLPEFLHDSKIMLSIMECLNALISKEQPIFDEIDCAYNDTIFKTRDYTKISLEAKLEIIKELGFDYILELFSLMEEADLEKLLIFFNLIYFLKGRVEGLGICLNALGIQEFTFTSWEETSPKGVPFTATLSIMGDYFHNTTVIKEIKKFLRSYMLPLIDLIITIRVEGPPLYIYPSFGRETRLKHSNINKAVCDFSRSIPQPIPGYITAVLWEVDGTDSVSAPIVCGEYDTTGYDFIPVGDLSENDVLTSSVYLHQDTSKFTSSGYFGKLDEMGTPHTYIYNYVRDTMYHCDEAELKVIYRFFDGYYLDSDHTIRLDYRHFGANVREAELTFTKPKGTIVPSSFIGDNIITLAYPLTLHAPKGSLVAINGRTFQTAQEEIDGRVYETVTYLCASGNKVRVHVFKEGYYLYTNHFDLSAEMEYFVHLTRM